MQKGQISLLRWARGKCKQKREEGSPLKYVSPPNHQWSCDHRRHYVIEFNSMPPAGWQTGKTGWDGHGLR